eukprot:763185-Hanusia_phi.AAC.6
MNIKNIFCTSVVLNNIAMASYLSTSPAEKRCFYLLVDIAMADQSRMQPVQVCKSPQLPWSILLQTSSKNIKSSSPEMITTVADSWSQLSLDAAVLSEGTNATDKLLRSYVLKPTTEESYVMNQLLHAEMRVRNIGQEISTLNQLQTNSQTLLQQASDQILKLQSELVQKLSFKKAALENGGSVASSLLNGVNADITALQQGISTAEQQQTQSQQKISQTQQGIQQLVEQDAKAQAQLLSSGLQKNSLT